MIYMNIYLKDDSENTVEVKTWPICSLPGKNYVEWRVERGSSLTSTSLIRKVVFITACVRIIPPLNLAPPELL